MRVVVTAVVFLALAGCGGASRDDFVRAANESCRTLKQERAALPETSDPADGIKPLERHVARLKQLEPPDGDRENFNQMLHFQQLGDDAWAEFSRYAAQQRFKEGEPALERAKLNWVRAAQAAGRMGLEDCDRALS